MSALLSLPLSLTLDRCSLSLCSRVLRHSAGFAEELFLPVDSVDREHEKPAGMGVRNTDGLRGYAAIFGDDRGKADDRKVSAGEGCRSVCTDDEREGAVSSRADDVRQQLRNEWRGSQKLNSTG